MTSDNNKSDFGVEPVGFDGLSRWQEDDHEAALSCFAVSARRMLERPYTTKAIGASSNQLAKIAGALFGVDAKPAIKGRKAARQFFEVNFLPHRLIDLHASKSVSGFVTGYFEPEVVASPTRSRQFVYPLLKRPPDLVSIDEKYRPPHLPPEHTFARETETGLTEYFDRKAIDNGALDHLGLELAWLEDPVDAFFIHIQGSARLRLTNGKTMRVGYAGKTGHPFTAIGRLLVDRGELTAANTTMQTIRKWLSDNPDQAWDLMWQNRSYIFFAENEQSDPAMGPVAAASVMLTPGRSIAADHRLHTFGTPVWIETHQPLFHETQPFRRLMTIQDTGSAIVGPARGDLFIGSGFEAGEIAGRIKHSAEFLVFLPRSGEKSGG